ncbi:MAG: T9SS type A sorting domain-containing protein [Bacteroidia bacterium]|nr:T9SS type A sorting domain-containing protein [Bacteroidia bacterium]
MRSIKIVLFLLLVITPGGFSQDLILKNGEQVVNSDTVYLSGTKTTELIEISLFVTNNRSTAISLKLRKTEIYVVEGAECSFCWGECYTPAVQVSPMAITIQPGATDRKSFVGDYRPFGMEGTSIVKYTFFDPADTTFQQSVTVFFQIGGSGLNNAGTSGEMVRVYPNPASDCIRIFLSGDVPVSHTATFVNMQGQVLISEYLPAGSREISWQVSKLPSGFYILRLRDEAGDLATYKIFIAH